jgi:UPF0271 protein
MGESFGSWAKGNDEAVMPFVDMANIACGMHASDPTTMARTVQLACRFGVSIGAHPGYPDLLGFGRRELELEAEELEACVLYQIGALDGICRAQGRRVEYVKPHGALYNRMMRDQVTLDSMIAAVRRYDAGLPLVVLGAGESANAALRERAAGQGVELWFEAFADRAYDARGRLVPRSEPGAVHTDVDRLLRQVKEIAEQGQVSTLDGGIIPLQADTLCLHGDNEQLLAAVGRIRAALS